MVKMVCKTTQKIISTQLKAERAICKIISILFEIFLYFHRFHEVNFVRYGMAVVNIIGEK